MKHKPCPFCHSTDIEFTSNTTYGHGDCGYNAWIECQSCGAQHGHVSDYGHPTDKSEHDAWDKWNGHTTPYSPKEIPSSELTDMELTYKRLFDQYGEGMSLLHFLMDISDEATKST